MRSAHEILALEERAKELRCLYRVGQAVAAREDPPQAVFASVLDSIPEGWQRPKSTGSRIQYLGRDYLGPGFGPSCHRLRASLDLFGTPVGFIEVVDVDWPSDADNAFLDEERELLTSIASRLSEYLEWKQQQLAGDPAGARRDHWRWRQSFAEALGRAIDAKTYGVEGLYLYGSTERGEAGPSSDIDLMIVFRGTEDQRRDLESFLRGYSVCLSEVARQHTGSWVDAGLLDVTFVDQDPSAGTQAFMRRLPLG